MASLCPRTFRVEWWQATASLGSLAPEPEEVAVVTWHDDTRVQTGRYRAIRVGDWAIGRPTPSRSERWCERCGCRLARDQGYMATLCSPCKDGGER
jgi:hypothetical protein